MAGKVVDATNNTAHKLNCSNCNLNPFVQRINYNGSFFSLSLSLTLADYNFYTRFGNEILHRMCAVVPKDSCFRENRRQRFSVQNLERSREKEVSVCCGYVLFVVHFKHFSFKF